MNKLIKIIFVLLSQSSFASYECKDIFLKNNILLENEHTIKNLSQYIEDNLGKKFIEILRENQKVYVVLGDGIKAQELLKSQGFTNVTLIEKSVGFHQTWAAQKDGIDVGIITRVNGKDRVEHITSFFDLLRIQVNVEFIGKQKSWEKEYLNAFVKIGPPPDLAVIGFSNTFTQSLMPSKTFILKPNLIWRKLKALWQKKRNSGVSDISTLPIQVLYLKNGKRIWFFQNVYGDLVLDIASALDKYDVKNILYAGTAGSLNAKLPIGTIVQPKEWVNEEGNLTELNWIKSLSQIDNSGRYQRVSTPNIETEHWLQTKLNEKIDLIEVELGHLFNFYSKKRDALFNAVLVVSDIMVGEHKQDLTIWSNANLLSLLSPFKKIIAEKLHVSETDLQVESYEAHTP